MYVYFVGPIIIRENARNRKDIINGPSIENIIQACQARGQRWVIYDIIYRYVIHMDAIDKARPISILSLQISWLLIPRRACDASIVMVCGINGQHIPHIVGNYIHWRRCFLFFLIFLNIIHSRLSRLRSQLAEAAISGSADSKRIEAEGAREGDPRSRNSTFENARIASGKWALTSRQLVRVNG